MVSAKLGLSVFLTRFAFKQQLTRNLLLRETICNPESGLCCISRWLYEFCSGDDDGTRLGDMLGRYGPFLFSHCKLSWKTSDQYVSVMKGLINNRFPILLSFNEFYKELRHNKQLLTNKFGSCQFIN